MAKNISFTWKLTPNQITFGLERNYKKNYRVVRIEEQSRYYILAFVEHG